jgi:gamma-glutamylcyclotransferase (GGCT)/AIG2-like uncharacterized protein YtfP
MQLVFVHGTLRKGFGLHRQLEDFECLGVFRLLGPNSVMVMLSPTSYPSVVPLPPILTVVSDVRIEPPEGEVYIVDNKTMDTLDMIEGVPSFYNRMYGHIEVHSDDMYDTLRDNDVHIDEDMVEVAYYGMEVDNPSLDRSLLVPHGQFPRAIKGDYGEPFRAWHDRVTEEQRKRTEKLRASRGGNVAHLWEVRPALRRDNDEEPEF